MDVRDVQDAHGTDSGQLDACMGKVEPVGLYESEPRGGREGCGGEGCEQGSSGHYYSIVLF
jgi:hypothetical protein